MKCEMENCESISCTMPFTLLRVCVCMWIMQCACIGTFGNETSKIRLFRTQSDFNAVFHLYFGYVCKRYDRHFQLKMHAIAYRIPVFWSKSTLIPDALWRLKNVKTKTNISAYRNLIVLMVTAQTLIAHT